MDYPLTKLTMGEVDIGFPTLFTNSMRCETCDLVFSQIRFEGDEMEKIYKEYRKSTYAELRNIFEPGYFKLNEDIGKSLTEIANRQMAMVDFLSSEIDVRAINSVLDHGGDAGQHIPYIFKNAEKFVYEVSGVEPVEDVKSVTDLKDMQSVDLIMNCNVIEHIPYPRNLVHEIKHLCHKDTVLFIDVPSERKAEKDFPTYFHEHINYFNEKSIRTLLQCEGFQVSKVKTYSIDFGWCQAKSTYVIAKPSWFED
jgi:SAM-dependent methyltransferase